MHPHKSAATEQRFIISLLLTSLVLVGELVGGWWTGSLALLSDAAHVFMDIFALGLSFIALKLSALPPDDRHTYGYHRLEVIAALINGITLGGIAIGIWSEAWARWQEPQSVRSLEMLIIAVAGLLINLVVAMVLRGGFHTHAGHETDPVHTGKDLNLQSAFLHVVGDAISSLGVIIAALLIQFTGWQWVDPLASALIGALILLSSFRVLRSTLHILIEGTPENITLQDVADLIESIPGVCNLHDLHIWNICSGHVALSAHIILDQNLHANHQAVLASIRASLQEKFGINHTTIQVDNERCIDENANCGGNCA